MSAILLLSSLVLALRTVQHINTQTDLFAERQVLAKAAIDNIEAEQNRLNADWLKMARKSDVVRREEILTELQQARSDMSASIESAYAQTEFLRESIYEEGHGLLRWTVWLFSACVLLSLACATWAVRATTGLFGRLEQQASQLTEMQYQFLESQEDVARRFSHELHDELGQLLTAIKANLSNLRESSSSTGRVDDCMRLVDEAVRDVREMSQLLRPTILDDFGLDAALRSLSEAFSQRTGIAVQYRSELGYDRLRDTTETHLYRIAQEALTNAARHAQATSITMELTKGGKSLRLAIRDDGKGFSEQQSNQRRGLGLAGMRTRAAGCGGTFRVSASTGKGTEIEVECPIAQ